MAAIFGAVNFTSVHQADASEEQQRDFEFDIQELLLTAGYFRARIANLSPFDKVGSFLGDCVVLKCSTSPVDERESALPHRLQVIGGLAWSITASNVEVDIHLIYDEDANIGQKIKLSEAIEFALKRMRCPYPLQAHQIQGLDYPAVFPVVQWLVKKARDNPFAGTLGRFSITTQPVVTLCPAISSESFSILALRRCLRPAESSVTGRAATRTLSTPTSRATGP